MKPRTRVVRAWAIYNEDDSLTYIYAPGKFEHGRLSVFVSKEAANKCPNCIDGIVEVEIRPISKKGSK